MQNKPELYKPDMHIGVRLPLESTKVSFANTIPNVLIPSGCNVLCCRFPLVEDDDVRITSLCPTCLPVAFMKKEDSMLLFPFAA